ncbi:MAG: hypothetical protein J5524_04575 [Bacteroidaceae bacterium]|nr:hypothetical protein [Bacteroidaceae bacterium]
MNQIEQLRALMTLDADMNTSDIERRFEQIAKMLFEYFAIQKGETKYLFKEIEFYFYNKNHHDIITHPRVSKPLCWYVNDFGGIDLNFSSNIEFNCRYNEKGKIIKKYVLDDSAYFGGVLVRQLIEKESDEVLKGPLACAELFRGYDAFGINLSEDIPVLVECDNGKTESITTKSRVNILRSNQIAEKKVDNILYAYSEYPEKEKLYKDFCDFIEKPYGYLR